MTTTAHTPSPPPVATPDPSHIQPHAQTTAASQQPDHPDQEPWQQQSSAAQPLQPLPPNTLHSHKMSVPQATPSPASPPTKRDLKSWWKGFKLQSRNHEAPVPRLRGIFGVPLRESIAYANVAISLVDDNGRSYIYGYVPIVVAKCGVFLKEKATEVEGIFRLSGSEKRIKELKIAFDSPDRYGKGMSWTGYTIHDAANVLRRYLNDLPEPVVPLDFYEPFREPLRFAVKPMTGDGDGPQFVENFDMNTAIGQYQHLITELPPLNRQLLLYILDLLAVFAAKSDINRMNSQNLAAIFQPGLLSHPNHDMAPEEYRLNQIVLIFLIENQDHFLIGMQGTAADEQTVKEVQRGTPPVTPGINMDGPGGLGVSRTASNASAGAESVARDGKIRRNRSTSSRNSRRSTSNNNALIGHVPSPRSSSPGLMTTTTTATSSSASGGLSRSNTLPARSPGLGPGRFRRTDGTGSPVTPLTPINHHSPSRATPSVAPVAEVTPAAEESSSPSHYLCASNASPSHSPRETGLGLSPNSIAIPLTLPPKEKESKDRKFPLFRSQGNDGEPRPQPNKLKKKRMPNSANPSAQSSTASLPPLSSSIMMPNHDHHDHHDHELIANSLGEHITLKRSAQSVVSDDVSAHHPASSPSPQPAELTPRVSQVHSAATTTTPTPTPTPSTTVETVLRTHRRSPSTSLHSSFNEGSDMDQVDDSTPSPVSDVAEQPGKTKKRIWRISRQRHEMLPMGPQSLGSNASEVSMQSRQALSVGSNTNAALSTSSVGSGGLPSASMAALSQAGASGSSDHTLNTEAHASQDSATGSSRDGKEGRLAIWLKNKYREAKENAESLRNRSPTSDDRSMSTRGKSLDLKRSVEEDKKSN